MYCTMCHHCVYLQPGPPVPSIPQPAGAKKNSKLSPQPTQISPTKTLVEPLFEHRSLIYLDQRVILEACLDDLLTAESGSYATDEVHIRVVNDLTELLGELN